MTKNVTAMLAELELDSLSEEILSSFIWWKVKKKHKENYFFLLFLLLFVCPKLMEFCTYLRRISFFFVLFSLPIERRFFSFCIIFTLYNNGNTIRNRETKNQLQQMATFRTFFRRFSAFQKRTGIKNFKSVEKNKNYTSCIMYYVCWYIQTGLFLTFVILNCLVVRICWTMIAFFHFILSLVIIFSMFFFSSFQTQTCNSYDSQNKTKTRK